MTTTDGEYEAFKNSDNNENYLDCWKAACKWQRARIAQLETEAELGKVAMKFIDRAADVHPGIDDAETICEEFSKAMAQVLDKYYEGE